MIDAVDRSRVACDGCGSERDVALFCTNNGPSSTLDRTDVSESLAHPSLEEGWALRPREEV